jgi:hypothetical protein
LLYLCLSRGVFLLPVYNIFPARWQKGWDLPAILRHAIAFLSDLDGSARRIENPALEKMPNL